MIRLRVFFHRVATLFRRSRIEADLEDEIRSHLEMQEDDHRRHGMNPEQARRAALRNFGGIDPMKERYRDRYRFPALESMVQDLRYAIRMLRKSPGFTATAVLTLALGIAANAAVFSIVYGVVLRPLPFKDSNRIVRIYQNQPGGAEPENGPFRMAAIRTDDLQQWRTQTRTFSQMAAYFTMQLMLLENGVSTRVRAGVVSPAMFPLLGVEPLLGRVLEAGDESEGNNAVVVVSHAAWQRYFSGQATVLHRTLSFGGRGYRVVGVMPPQFEFPDRDTEFWIPLVLNPSVPAGQAGGVGLVGTLARLAGGVSLQAATTEANALFLGFRRKENRDLLQNGLVPSGPNENIRIELVRIEDELVGPVRPALLVLLVAVGLVLLIACANVANLLLARATGRQAEIAIRAALGAGRSRLVRQVLTESLTLALCGGTLGTILAFGGVHLLTVIGASSIPRIERVHVNAPVFAFTFAVSVCTGILFGLVPALRVQRQNHLEAITNGNASASSGSGLFGRNRTRSLLAITEIALAMILLVASGLLISSFLKLSHTDWGYDAENLLTFRADPPSDRYPNLVQAQTFYEELLARLQALPGVRSAAISNSVPILMPENMGAAMYAEGRPAPANPREVVTALRVVSNSYLDAMAMKLLQGRGFTDRDRAGQPQVMLVNQTMARLFFPNQDAVGRRVHIGVPQAPPVEIIGIVGDVRYAGLDAEPGPEIYMNIRQVFTTMPEPPPPPGAPPPIVGGLPSPAAPTMASRMGVMFFAVRTTGDPLNKVAAIRSVVGRMDSQITVDDVATMEQRLEIYVARPRFYATLLGTFAAIAAVLALVGIYGLMAYSVSQRRREIGIRIALGADRREVLWMVLRQGLVLTTIGLIAGLLGSWALTRYLKDMLYGLTATDPLTFIIAAAGIACAAALASYVPARRATRVDPMTALRYE